eukprot:4052603-Lingulodinium_polyedra.AAC.1
MSASAWSWLEQILVAFDDKQAMEHQGDSVPIDDEQVDVDSNGFPTLFSRILGMKKCGSFGCSSEGTM